MLCCRCRSWAYFPLSRGDKLVVEAPPPLTLAAAEQDSGVPAPPPPPPPAAAAPSRPRLLSEATARTTVDAAERDYGLESPETIIARNNLVGFLMGRGCLASLEEARGLAAAVEASLVATLGERHPAALLGRSNAAAVAAALAALAAPPPSPLPPPRAPPPPDPSALLAPLAGRWLIDEGASQNTGALLRYFGAPWLVVQAVTAGATPPLVVELLAGAVRVSYPGAFAINNTYSFSGPSTHASAFSKAQPCALEVTAEPPGFTVSVPQAPGKGTLLLAHHLRGGRCVCSIVIRKGDGTEPVRIPRVYDREGGK